MRQTVFLCLIAAATLAGCARDRMYGGMDWSLSSVDGEGLKLAYGQPDSDDVTAMLTCTPSSGTVRIAQLGRRDEDMTEAAFTADDPRLLAFVRDGRLPGQAQPLPVDRGKAQRFLAACRS